MHNTTHSHLSSMSDLEARAQSGNAAAMLELGQLLDTTTGISDALLWVRRAADAGLASANLQIAVWMMAGRHMPKDESTGAQSIIACAKSGDPLAGRLAVNLYASGTGVEQSWDKATNWLCRLGKASDAAALLQLAIVLRPHPRLNRLRHTLLYAAAQAGLPSAKYLLGTAMMAVADQQSRAVGLGWMSVAASDGHRLAQIRLEQFVGETMRRAQPPAMAAKVPWADIRRLIILPHDLPLPNKQPLSRSPEAHVQQGFLSPVLCDYMIGAGAPHLAAATVHDANAGEILDNTRTNSFANFRLLEADLLTLSVSARMMRAMACPADHGDPLSLLQYEAGQSYAPHYDFFDPSFPAHRPHLKDGGQRVKTGLLYLNEDYRGGATCFHHTDLLFKGKQGCFLQFSNVDDAGNADRSSLHSGEPPHEGTKWVLTKWAREAHRSL